MKYLLFLCEGLSDRPVAAMDGKTPLSAAEKPVLDRLASEGETGLIRLADYFDYPEAIKADMRGGDDDYYDYEEDEEEVKQAEEKKEQRRKNAAGGK